MVHVRPRRARPIMRVVIPVWVVPPIAWEPAPLSTLAVPKTLSAFVALAWPTSRTRLHFAIYRRGYTFRWKTASTFTTLIFCPFRQKNPSNHAKPHRHQNG
jgi:hypothetical protein